MAKQLLSGNGAQALAARLARVQVIAAYPITPQTSIVEYLAEAVESGALPAQYLCVESEHSALAACLSAAATGARTYTATSSQGLALMHEILHYATGQRAPVVMGVVNRALAMPWNIWTDHSDTISQRDTGWLQFYCESNQEVLDTVLQAYRLCEDPDVLLPAMVIEDAFSLSHTVEGVEVPEAAEVDAFLPKFEPAFRLDVESPGHMGGLLGPDLYTEHRYNIARATDRAHDLLEEVEEEFRRRFGRYHGGTLDLYRTDDADAVLVAMGTAAGTARVVVDALRDKGVKVGLARLRVFRPFPLEEIRALAKDVNSIGVLDRSFTFGAFGAVHGEIAAAVQALPERPFLRGYIGGLGGRDLTPEVLEGIFRDLLKGDDGGPEVEWVGLRRYRHPEVTR